MSIVQIEMYGAKCDHCKKQWEHHDGYTAMPDLLSMSSEIMEAGWHSGNGCEGEKDKHYCDDCFSYDDMDQFFLIPSRENLFLIKS